MSIRLQQGVQVRLDSAEWVISDVNYALGYVTLRGGAGAQQTVSIDEFISNPTLADRSAPSAPQDAALQRLHSSVQDVAHKRLGHVLEAQTGYRSGTAAVALPHEPRPEYDPARTTLTERRYAKAAELDNEHARDAGTHMGYTTIRRIWKQFNAGTALDGIVDHRLVRRSPGRTSINSQVAKACEEVFERTRLGSNTTHQARYLLVKQYMKEVHGTDKAVPCEKTITRWFKDRFIPSELTGKARTRRSATTAPVGGFSRSNPTRPGELVCIDTCSLDVLLKGTAYEGVIRGVIVLAVDWYSRSIVAIRVLEGSERAIDVTFLIREIGRPKPMLPGMGEDDRWPFVGLPESVLTDVYGGENYSGMPFVNVEAVVTDHGNTYKAHLNVATAQQQGISILPARVRTGSDKQVVERTFGSLKTMLLQYLDGYRGSDTSERGESVDDQVKYSVQDIEDLVSWWAVRIWQNHVLSDARPDWCPEGEFSPNTLYEYGLAQTGMPLRAMSPNDYYAALPAVHVKVHSRGVHIKGLYYDDTTGGVLDAVRNVPSPYGGAVSGKWTVKYDPRDLRRVFFLDPDGVYQPLTWIGATRHTPCFNDKHATALSRLRRQRNIAAHDQDALAELLLTEVLMVHQPVSAWPTLSREARKEITKRRGAEESRRARQEEMVERDAAKSGVGSYASTFPADLDREDEFDGEDGEDGVDGVDTHAPRPDWAAAHQAPQPVETPNAAVTALDQARSRKQTTALPTEDRDAVAPAPRLGSNNPTVNYAALAAAREAAQAALASDQPTDQSEKS